MNKILLIIVLLVQVIQAQNKLNKENILNELQEYNTKPSRIYQQSMSKYKIFYSPAILIIDEKSEQSSYIVEYAVITNFNCIAYCENEIKEVKQQELDSYIVNEEKIDKLLQNTNIKEYKRRYLGSSFDILFTIIFNKDTNKISIED